MSIISRIQPGIDIQQRTAKESMSPITEQEEECDEVKDEGEEQEEGDADAEVSREEIPKVELLLGDIDQQPEDEGEIV